MEWVVVMYVGVQVFSGPAENEEACRMAARPGSGITVYVRDQGRSVKPDRIECVPRYLTN